MYYVLQVTPGEEEKTEALIMAILPGDLYGECFYLTKHMRKKFHKRWVDIQEKLLPGYVFIATENVKEVFLELKRVPMLTNILGRDGGSFSELSMRDAKWLEKIKDVGVRNTIKNKGTGNINKSWYEVGLSQVHVYEGNEIKIVSGPLKGIEGTVRKINLHKRIAEVEIQFIKRKIVIYLGIEMLESTCKIGECNE